MAVRRSRIDWSKVVPHPRYGNLPISSDTVIDDERLLSWLRKSRQTIPFPETAIKANLEKQNYSVLPKTYYVDLLETCRNCQRPFLFFAREQQYWYEELGFNIAARCVLCPECRRDQHKIRGQKRRYDQLVGIKNLDDKQLLALATSVAALWNAGVLTDEQKLRRAKNLAVRRLPERSATKRLCELVEQLS